MIDIVGFWACQFKKMLGNLGTLRKCLANVVVVKSDNIGLLRSDQKHINIWLPTNG